MLCVNIYYNQQRSKRRGDFTSAIRLTPIINDSMPSAFRRHCGRRFLRPRRATIDEVTVKYKYRCRLFTDAYNPRAAR